MKRAVLAVLCALAAPAHGDNTDGSAWFNERGEPSDLAQQAVAKRKLPRLVEGAPIFVGAYDKARYEEGGCVTLQFTIRPDGLTDKFLVLDSQPKGAFDEPVLRSLKFWKFEPGPAARRAILPVEFPSVARTGTRVAKPAPACVVPAVRMTGTSLEGFDHGRVPDYPPPLVAARKQGCATVAFKVQPNGKADDFIAVDAAPDDAFVMPSLQVLDDWSLAGLKPGKQVVLRFEYGIPDAGLAPPPACKWPKVRNFKEPT